MAATVSNEDERNDGSMNIALPTPSNADQAAQLKKINERNAVFYAQQEQKLCQQITDAAVKIAWIQRESEAARGIPFGYWSFHRAVDDAVKSSALVKIETARRAGKSKKTDPLQELILNIVRTNPSVNASQLYGKLETLEKVDIIDDIDDGAIWFMKPNGKLGKAPVSGLKDRLSRAKEIIKKELAQTG